MACHWICPKCGTEAAAEHCPKCGEPLMAGVRRLRLRITPEWRDPGDDGILWTVIEDNGQRLLIEAQLGLAINPRQVVRRDMVEFIEAR